MLLVSVILSLLVFKIFAAPISQHQSAQDYTIVFNSSHPEKPAVSAVLERLSLHPAHPDVRHVYNNSAFSGFTASMQSHCLEILRNTSGIAIIEEILPVRSTVTAQIDAPWGLQRISTASTVNGNGDGLAYTYTYANDGLGEGADVYILDTGIYTEHEAFTDRAKMVWSFDGNLTDNVGHGTHVSGIAGGQTIGVASNANLLGVKALDTNGTGWSSNVVAGEYALRSRISTSIH